MAAFVLPPALSPSQKPAASATTGASAATSSADSALGAGSMCTHALERRRAHTRAQAGSAAPTIISIGREATTSGSSSAPIRLETGTARTARTTLERRTGCSPLHIWMPSTRQSARAEGCRARCGDG
jgi:hypothetical protein